MLHLRSLASRRAGLLVLAPLAALCALAPPAVAAAPWSEIEALEQADRLEEALAALPPTAEPLEAARVEIARTRLLQKLGRSAEAILSGQEARELADRRGDAGERIEARRQLANAHQGLDQHPAATELLRESLALVAPLRDPRRELELLLDLAFSVSSQHDYVEAESILRRAEALGASAGDDRLSSRLWNAWATLHSFQGDNLQAIEARERALPGAERSGDRRLLAATLNNLAQNAMRMHDYARALTVFERALALDPPPRVRIIATVSLGICHLELNQLVEAERALLEAERLAAEIGNDHLRGWAIGELGLVSWRRRNDVQALERFDRAAAACRASRNARNEAIWWQNKGMVRRDQERWEEALVFYREAERVAATVPGYRPDPNLGKHVGQCLAGLGRSAEAEALFDEALAGATAKGDAKVVWETQRERARLLRRTGRPGEAMAAYEATLTGIESIRRSLQLESFKTDFFEDKLGVYAEVVEFVLERGGEDAPRRAFELTERARARGFLDSLVETRTRADDFVPEPIVREERRILNEISRLQSRLRRKGPDEAVSAELAAREQELQAFHLSLLQDHPRLRALRYPEPASLAAVQRTLPEGALLLAYFLAEPYSHLWSIRRDRVTHRRLPPAPEIESAVRAALAGLLDPTTAPTLEPVSRLVLPEEELVSAPASLVVVPAGILHVLPFEALPTAGGVLDELAPTSYLPSASALLELPVESGPQTARLLAVADPVYEGPRSAGRSAALGALRELGPLPRTRDEARAVVATFGGRASRLLVGEGALESRFKAEHLEEFSVLHLATHGWIDPSSPARSGLLLGAEPGGEDGLLQFREILRLPLDADLVTLSACHTATGELVTGEGMVGLTRAFFYAGARSVVASLWSVHDEASAELMRRFYRRLRRGDSKAEALRAARRELRGDARFAHPYYWAPFVLVGRADDRVELPADLRPALSGALLALLALVAWRWRRRRAGAS